MQLYRTKIESCRGKRPLAFFSYSKNFLFLKQLLLIVPERWLS
jgi:hypothetical protein